MMPRGRAAISTRLGVDDYPNHRRAGSGPVGRHGCHGMEATRHRDAGRVLTLPPGPKPCRRRTLEEWSAAMNPPAPNVRNQSATVRFAPSLRSAPQGDKGREGGGALHGTGGPTDRS